MPSYLCLVCEDHTDHVNVRQAALLAQVSRGTVYNWMRRGLLHYVIRPSGRKFICVKSILHTPSVREPFEDDDDARSASPGSPLYRFSSVS